MKIIIHILYKFIKNIIKLQYIFINYIIINNNETKMH